MKQFIIILLALFGCLWIFAPAAHAQFKTPGSFNDCSASTGALSDPQSSLATIWRQAYDRRIMPVSQRPQIADECSIAHYAVAVGDQGQLRDIYRDGSRDPDSRYPIRPENQSSQYDKFIAPVIGNLKIEIAKHAAVLIANFRRRNPDYSLDDQHVLDDLAKQSEDPSGRTQSRVNILIYAHGGLVSHSDAVLAAESLAPPMMRDGYIPLFLIWNSDLRTSYLDRLCCVRRGSIDENLATQAYFAPTRFISDVGSGVMSAPENIGAELARYYETNVRDYDLYYLNYNEVRKDCDFFDPKSAGSDLINYCKRRIVFPDFPGSDLETFKDNPKNSNDDPQTRKMYRLLNGKVDDAFTGEDAMYAAMTPVWLLTTTLAPQIGTKAWENMLRRTRIGFDSEWDEKLNKEIGGCYDEKYPPKDAVDELKKRKDEALSCPNGGFTRFFDAFRAMFDPDSLCPRAGTVAVPDISGRKTCDDIAAAAVTVDVTVKTANGDAKVETLKVPVSIEFYGHSMGAIVGDELMSRYDDLPWSKIVYMAAADTIREFRATTARVIAARRGTLTFDNGVHFYNLTLHPLNESREKEMYGAVPQGSLLEWVDEMFNGPKTADDRTMGKWKNFEATLPTWNRTVLDHMTIRVFPRQRKLRNDNCRAGASDACATEVLFEQQCDPSPVPGMPNGPDICHPLKHGDFNHYTFWRPAFYTGQPAVR